MDQPDRCAERNNKILVGLRKRSREVANAARHVRDDIDHASAGVHEQSDRGIDFVLFFEDLDVLRLVVLINAEIVLRQVVNEIPLVILYSGEDVDEVDIHLECLRKTQTRGHTQKDGNQYLSHQYDSCTSWYRR